MGWLYLNKIIVKIKKITIDYFYTNIYDHFFGNPEFKLSTPNLFYYSLKNIEPNSRILDFGCGNGICYSNQLIKDVIKKNNLKIDGIDIDKIYINRCLERIEKDKLGSNINVKLQDIFKYKVENDLKFDYIILSESAPLLSEDFLNLILKYMIKYLLKPNGKIIFINNLTENSSPMVMKLKPMLKYVCMIDFGRILTKKEFIKLADEFNLNVEFNLIAKMNVNSILSFFNMSWTFYIWNLLGVDNYDVEQYEIKFF